MDRHAIARATEIVRNAHRIVALTGAGISRPSGIPDFRSADGLWTRDDPMVVASLAGFRADPRRFYNWVQPLVATIKAALPNPAHLALAHLEHAGQLTAVITQNIDGLHQRAGSREVLELHGHIRSATCLDCGHQVPGLSLIEPVREGKIPHWHMWWPAQARRGAVR